MKKYLRIEGYWTIRANLIEFQDVGHHYYRGYSESVWNVNDGACVLILYWNIYKKILFHHISCFYHNLNNFTPNHWTKSKSWMSCVAASIWWLLEHIVNLIEFLICTTTPSTFGRTSPQSSDIFISNRNNQKNHNYSH